MSTEFATQFSHVRPQDTPYVDQGLRDFFPYRDLGIARVVVSLPSAQADRILPILDRWAELIYPTQRQ